ncbi:MAG: YceI family protein [Bryobacteraceae bacterium]
MRFLAVLGLAVVLAPAATYRIDSSHSSVQFKVKHLMITNVRGEFGKVAGMLVFDPAKPGESKVEAAIPVETVNSREAKRDSDLKGPDWFDAAKFPQVTFKSTKFEAAGPGKFKVTGDLTMHGTTKQVVLEVDGVSGEVKGSRGDTRMGAQAVTRINRRDFGMTSSPAAVVADEVEITLDLEFIKQ